MLRIAIRFEGKGWKGENVSIKSQINIDFYK